MGCGAVWQNAWIQLVWESKSLDKSIAAKELVPIVLAYVTSRVANQSLLEKWFPLQSERAHPLKFFVYEKSISIQIQSKSNPILYCSSFFLCLQGQLELCSSYHLLQSCFSFFVCLHGQPESFGSCIILQSSSSFFFRLHSQPDLFASDHLL